MRCFFHIDTPAVGSCKSCGRGLCQQCATAYPQGLACRGRCESEVEALVDLINSNVKAGGLGTQLLLGYRRALFASAGFITLMGGIFAAAAFRGEGVHLFLFGFGSLCLGFGVYHFFRAFRLKE